VKGLIVEDDFTSRKLLLAFLGKYGSCDVAVDGKEAINAFETAFREGEPYDLICLDIMMPEIDGHGVLRSIRDFEESNDVAPERRVKIVMTSALGDPKNVLNAFQSGCEAYLEKPLDKASLIAELQKLGLID
jgi:two-component system chemotaxis response regulator CheY